MNIADGVNRVRPGLGLEVLPRGLRSAASLQTGKKPQKTHLFGLALDCNS
jgi:hypothetical protein